MDKTQASEACDGGSIPPGDILLSNFKSKIITVIGPTASGKSALAVKLAKKFKGEIISADSRQVYRGLDIGSGKITKQEMKGIPHYLLDIVNPKKVFSAADFQKLGRKKIEEITQREKLPIICGGTGFYVDTLIKNLTLPPVPPNPKLRAKLEKLPTEKLAHRLKNLDLKRFKNIDQHNRPRLIRAIEIATKLGHVPPLGIKGRPCFGKGDPCHLLQIGIAVNPDKLRQNIHERLFKRLRAGLIGEVKKLHANGVSWKRLEAFGLEYRYVALYLQNKISKKDLLSKLERDIWRYAKRQMTWWKRNKDIKWVKNYQEAEKLVRDFIRK